MNETALPLNSPVSGTVVGVAIGNSDKAMCSIKYDARTKRVLKCHPSNIFLKGGLQHSNPSSREQRELLNQHSTPSSKSKKQEAHIEPGYWVEVLGIPSGLND